MSGVAVEVWMNSVYVWVFVLGGSMVLWHLPGEHHGHFDDLAAVG